MTWYEYALSLGYRHPMYLPQKIKDEITEKLKEESLTQKGSE